MILYAFWNKIKNGLFYYLNYIIYFYVSLISSYKKYISFKSLNILNCYIIFYSKSH